jgi:hypothetical protein
VNVPKPATPQDLRSHLKLLHGIYVDDEKSVAGLRECHDSDHEDRWSHARIEHRHM